MTCPETSWARIVRGLIAETPTVCGPLVDLTDIESMDPCDPGHADRGLNQRSNVNRTDIGPVERDPSSPDRSISMSDRGKTTGQKTRVRI